MNLNSFGSWLHRERRNRDMSLEVLAKKVGTHKGYISGIENGKVSPPSEKIIAKIAKVFGEDVQSLLFMSLIEKAPPVLRTRMESKHNALWCMLVGDYQR